MNRLCSLSLAIASLVTVPSGVLAQNAVGGTHTSANVTIDDAFNWVVITKATVYLVPGPPLFIDSFGCVVNASADVFWNGGAAGQENRYRFTVSQNTSLLTDLGTERTLSMVNTSGENPNYYPVSTTRAYEGLTSSDGVNGTAEHTFYLLGRKVASTDPDVTVTDASTSVVCVQTIS